MTPIEYVEIVAVPALKGALAARGDRGPNYLACIAIFHAHDYLALSRGEPLKAIREVVKGACGPAYAVVRGVCNGTKHGEPLPARDVPVFALDTPGAGFDEGRFDVPGLGVEHEGIEMFMDWCAQIVLITLCRRFPAELGAVDLSFLDPNILTGPRYDPPEPRDYY